MTTTPPRLEVSSHECRLFSHLKTCRQWQTVRQIAEATGIAARTANNHTKRLSACGLLERMETHPAPMFRFTAESAQADPAYVARIANACVAFGVEF
jgi:predicted transcriptional regulator